MVTNQSQDRSSFTQETKYQGLLAKAKAKKLARNQMSSNELFDKLIKNDAKKDAKEPAVHPKLPNLVRLCL